MTTQPLRFGTTGHTGSWTGVLRRGRAVVADCGHRHMNRDYGDMAARECIRHLVLIVRRDGDQEWIARALDVDLQAARLGARVDPERAATRAQEAIDAVRASGALTEQVIGTLGWNATLPAVVAS